jgi:ribosomal protein L32
MAPQEIHHGRPAEQEVAVQARHAPLAQRRGRARHGVEPTTGEVHLRHHISPTGFYRGRKVLKTKADA